MKFLILLMLLASCSTSFKPYKEVGWICEDILTHTGCKRSNDKVDNIDFFEHDKRELESLEVPSY